MRNPLEGYMYHVGPDRMHGVFYDTASTRSVMDHTHWDGPHYAPETEQRDLDALTEVVDFTRKFWRDNVLDNEAIVIANSGNKGLSQTNYLRGFPFLRKSRNCASFIARFTSAQQYRNPIT